MADNQRYRSGPISEVKSVVKAGVLAEVGDLVCLTGTGSKVVETIVSSGLTATTFRAAFLGVLVQGATRGTETANSPCLVYTTGEFEYPLSVAAAAALPIGNLVEIVSDQVVTAAAGTTIANGIGRLAKPIAVGDTTCLVKIESVVFGGPQTAVVA
jgi:hypothetical protein